MDRFIAHLKSGWNTRPFSGVGGGMIDERIAASLDEAVAERSDAAFALLEQLVSVRSEVGTESDASSSSSMN